MKITIKFEVDVEEAIKHKEINIMSSTLGGDEDPLYRKENDKD